MNVSIRNTLESIPLLKRLLRPISNMFQRGRNVSHSYIELDESVREAEASKLRSSWLDETLPSLQRKLVDEQLGIFRAGGSVDVFNVITAVISEITVDGGGSSLIEIGCSSGYYSEVFEIAGLDVEYTGCDYSATFIDMAKSRYPNRSFTVADATALPFANEAFDIALSGCCLLHIPEYERAIEETARVTRKYAIFHRTPVILDGDTKYFTKTAYNVKTIEIHFSENEFYEMVKRSGLLIIDVYTLVDNTSGGQHSAVRTYVCKKLA